MGWALRRSSPPSQLVLLSTGCENPKPSLTELEVLEHGLYAGAPVSKVLLRPLTGVSGPREAGCFEAAKGVPPTPPRAPASLPPGDFGEAVAQGHSSLPGATPPFPLPSTRPHPVLELAVLEGRRGSVAHLALPRRAAIWRLTPLLSSDFLTCNGNQGLPFLGVLWGLKRATGDSIRGDVSG